MEKKAVKKQFWLVKSEPLTYGIEHLKKDRETPWTGVRNFQARNFMRDDMQVGDEVFFYHSSCAQPGIYGLATVASEPYPDETQFDATSDYFDRRATPENPLWFLVDIAFKSVVSKPLLLTTIRNSATLKTMAILQQGSRLSITPVTTHEAGILHTYLTA